MRSAYNRAAFASSSRIFSSAQLGQRQPLTGTSPRANRRCTVAGLIGMGSSCLRHSGTTDFGLEAPRRRGDTADFDFVVVFVIVHRHGAATQPRSCEATTRMICGCFEDREDVVFRDSIRHRAFVRVLPDGHELAANVQNRALLKDSWRRLGDELFGSSASPLVREGDLARPRSGRSTP